MQSPFENTGDNPQAPGGRRSGRRSGRRLFIVSLGPAGASYLKVRIPMNDERLTLYFRFLDNLREGGSINMLGAAQPLKDRFGLETEEANTAHSLWMETFTHELTAAERADEALRRVAARS